MDELRVVLLIMGVIAVVGVYLWERWRRRQEQRVESARSVPEDVQVERELQRLSGLVASAREDLSLERADSAEPEAPPPRTAGSPSPDTADRSGQVHGTKPRVQRPTAAGSKQAGSRRAPETPRAASPNPEPAAETRRAQPAAAARTSPAARRGAVAREQRVRVGAGCAADTTAPPGTGEARDARELIITMTLLALPGEQFSGAELLQALKKAGLVYGEMGIFHRPPPGDLTGEPLFSVANILEPGYFDLSDSAQLATPGLAVFMRLPGPARGSYAFREMVDAVDKLALMLRADVCDEQRRAIDSEALQALWDKVIAFDSRQSRPL